MKKPNFFYFRPANFLNDFRGMGMAARGATMTLVAEMFQRWQPERESLPCLPDDERLLQRLCGGAKNWHRVRNEVLPNFVKEGDKLVSPLLNAELQRLAKHWEKGDRKTEKKAKREKSASPVAKPVQAQSDPAIGHQQRGVAPEQPAKPAYVLQDLNAATAEEFQQRLTDGSTNLTEGKNQQLVTTIGGKTSLFWVDVVKFGDRWSVIAAETGKGIRFDARGDVLV